MTTPTTARSRVTLTLAILLSAALVAGCPKKKDDPVADLVISTTSLPNTVENLAYNQVLTAAGGTAPYTWSILSGALPPTYSLDASTGAITGTAPVGGTGFFAFTAQVADVSSPQKTATQDLSITIGFDTSILRFVTTSLPNGNVGTFYQQTAQIFGGTGPYTFAVATGALPTGVALNTATGELTGTPTLMETATFEISCTDSSGPPQLDTQSFSVTIGPTILAITSAAVDRGYVGIPYSMFLTADYGVLPYAWSVTAGTLPAGLSLNSFTGEISGTPTGTSSGSVTFRVTDNAVDTADRAYTVTVVTPIVITTSTLPDATSGTGYATTPAITGGASPFVWTVDSGSLPTGLSLTAGSGLISGTPSVAGGYSFTLRVDDSTNPAITATKNLSIDVRAPLTIPTTALPDGFETGPYSFDLTGSGGKSPYIFTISTGTLPTGLSLSSSGTISGTITGSAGAYPVTYVCTDSGTPPRVTTKGLTLTVTATPAVVTIVTTTAPNGTATVAYSKTLSAVGGTPPYTWALEGASTPLPPGLSITAGGVITGTPTLAGTYPFTVEVTDAVPGTDTQALTIVVFDALVITDTTVPRGTTIASYSHTLTATGGTGGYTWALASGSLGDLSLSTPGAITGTPLGSGSFAFTAEVTDGATPPNVTTKAFTLFVDDPVFWVTSTIADPNRTVPYDATVIAAGGLSPLTYSITAGPSWAAIDPSTGKITGIPDAEGAVTITVLAEDSLTPTPRSASQDFDVTVGPPVFAIADASPLVDGQISVAYSVTLSTVNGTPSYTWSIASGALPTGCSLGAGTGTISGTPITTYGTFNFTVSVSDGTLPTAQVASKAFKITIRAADIDITTTSLTAGTKGSVLSKSIGVSGGAPAYSWSIVSGTLPAGVTLAATGAPGSLSGTPTESGDFSFTVAVSDSQTPADTDSQALTLRINAPPDVLSVTPPDGSFLGGTDITISGTDFRDVTGVTVDGVAILNLVVVNETTITGTTPTSTSGSGAVAVAVTTLHGSDSLASGFTYVGFSASVGTTDASAVPRVTPTTSVDLWGEFAVAKPTATSGPGNIYLAWTDDRTSADGDIYFTFSDDAGATWATSVRLDTAAATVPAVKPTICVDDAGDIHVLWQEEVGGDPDIVYVKGTYSSGTGLVTFGAPAVLAATDTTFIEDYPHVICAGGNDLILVWAAPIAGTYRIGVTISLDGGASWSTVTYASESGITGFHQNPRVAVDSTGIIHVAWMDFRDDPGVTSKPYYSQSTTAYTALPTAWTADLRLDDTADTTSTGLCDIVVDSTDRVFVVYSGLNSGNADIWVLSADAADAGTGIGSWSANTKVNTDSGTSAQNRPRIATSAYSGFTYIVWDDFRSGSSRDIYLSATLDNGTTWQTEGRVDDDAGSTKQWKPTIRVEDGIVYVVWIDEGTTPDSLRLATLVEE